MASSLQIAVGWAAGMAALPFLHGPRPSGNCPAQPGCWPGFCPPWGAPAAHPRPQAFFSPNTELSSVHSPVDSLWRVQIGPLQPGRVLSRPLQPLHEGLCELCQGQRPPPRRPSPRGWGPRSPGGSAGQTCRACALGACRGGSGRPKARRLSGRGLARPLCGCRSRRRCRSRRGREGWRGWPCQLGLLDRPTDRRDAALPQASAHRPAVGQRRGQRRRPQA